MLNKKRGGRKQIFLLMTFLCMISLLLSGAVFAIQETHAGSKQETHNSPGEGAAEGGHGSDRSGDHLDLLYRFINFALMIIILVVALKKSNALGYFSKRIEEIKQNLEDQKREREEAEESYREIEKRLREFEEEKKDIIEQAKKEGLAERSRIIAEAEDRAKQIIDQADLTIQHELESATHRLEREVMDLAARRAREIIASEMTDDDQDRLVTDFIERIGKIH